jgi:hypothetical protein
MKATFNIIIWTLTLLLISSILSYMNKLHVDGLERFGFPFVIFESCGDCVAGFESGFRWNNIILNAFIYALIVAFLYFNFKKISKKV